MECIYCGSETKVTNSRTKKKGHSTWRRRKCVACASIFTTSEEPVLEISLSVKGVDGLAPFNRQTLWLSLHGSLKHRSASVDDATAIVKTIVNELMTKSHQASISKSDIKEVAETALKRFDNAAAVHYGAFHRGK